MPRWQTALRAARCLAAARRHARFFGLILATSGLLSIGITPALIMLAPLSAVAIHLMMSDPDQRTAQTKRRLDESARLYPRLASEALLFLAAGCAGSVMADAFPAS